MKHFKSEKVFLFLKEILQEEDMAIEIDLRTPGMPPIMLTVMKSIFPELEDGDIVDINPISYLTISGVSFEKMSIKETSRILKGMFALWESERRSQNGRE